MFLTYIFPMGYGKRVIFLQTLRYAAELQCHNDKITKIVSYLMKSQQKKPVYLVPRTVWTMISMERNLCQSSQFGATLESMNEDEYEWEI